MENDGLEIECGTRSGRGGPDSINNRQREV